MSDTIATPLTAMYKKRIWPGLQSYETKFFVLMGFAVTLSVAQTLVLARVLDPEGLGLFAMASTIAALGGLLQMGTLSGLTRELPVLIGRGHLAKADSFVKGATSVLFGITVLGVLIVGVGVLAYPWDTVEFRTAIILAGLWVGARFFSELSLIRLRSEESSILFPTVILAQRVLTILVGTLMADRFGFIGLVTVILSVEAITYIVLTLVFLRRVGFGFPAISDMRYLIRIGLPQALAGTLRFGQLSGEKLFIVWQAGTAVAGVYQIAWWPAGAAIALNGILNQYLAPRLLREFGEHGSVETVFKETLRATVIVLVVCGLLAVPVGFALKPLVTTLLPEYADAVPTMRIFMVSGVIMLANLSHIAILAANRPDLLFKLQLFTSVTTIGAYAVVTSMTVDLNWIAYVALTGIVVDFLLRLVIARHLSSTSV